MLGVWLRPRCWAESSGLLEPVARGHVCRVNGRELRHLFVVNPCRVPKPAASLFRTFSQLSRWL